MGYSFRITTDNFLDGEEIWDPPEFSKDISVAWEVVEKIGGMCVRGPYGARWIAESLDSGQMYGNSWSGTGTTAPHAICLAALAAVGWKEDEPGRTK
jgi:hypothetical protein